MKLARPHALLLQWRMAGGGAGIDPAAPIPRTSRAGLAALARTIIYKYSDPRKLPVAPDAQFFPGLPPAGTQPSKAPVTRSVRPPSGAGLRQELAQGLSTPWLHAIAPHCPAHQRTRRSTAAMPGWCF